jgi:hypothetical protein
VEDVDAMAHPLDVDEGGQAGRVVPVQLDPITSTMQSCRPGSTAVPTSTNGGAPGSGARQKTPTVDDSTM